jgi:hypothetical protein
MCMHGLPGRALRIGGGIVAHVCHLVRCQQKEHGRCWVLYKFIKREPTLAETWLGAMLSKNDEEKIFIF